MLRDTAVGNPIEEHQIRTDRPSSCLDTGELDSMKEARDLFSVCVAADPTFAAGWAWLGRSARFLDKFKHDTPTNLAVAQAAFQRALAIDPDLACAHHFYTQLQVDLGQSRDAVVRLAERIVRRRRVHDLLYACSRPGLQRGSFTARVQARNRRSGARRARDEACQPVEPHEPASTGVSEIVRRSPFRISDTSTGRLIRSSFRIRCMSSMPATAAPLIA